MELFPNLKIAPARIAGETYQTPSDIGRLGRRPKKKQQKAAPREKVSRKKEKRNPFRQPVADAEETNFRHGAWHEMRELRRRHLYNAGASRSCLDAWDNCGAECTIEWSESLQQHRLRATYCHNRHCIPCHNQKAGLIAENLRTKLADRKTHEKHRFRFMTLTIRHSDEPLCDQLKFLNDSFTKLRKSKLWKTTQDGGCSMIEINYHPGGRRLRDDGSSYESPRGWHPHLHLVVDGRFIRQGDLSDAWSRITGGSFKVDVRVIASEKDAVHYVTKYVAKGCSDTVWQHDDAAQEWIAATRGLRTCATFGTWRGFKLTKPSDKQRAKDWQPIALLSRVSANARTGSMPDIILLMKLEDCIRYDPRRKKQRQSTWNPLGENSTE